MVSLLQQPFAHLPESLCFLPLGLFCLPLQFQGAGTEHRVADPCHQWSLPGQFLR